MATTNSRIRDLSDPTGLVAIATGGAGLPGYRHGAILAAAGANVALLDLARANPALCTAHLQGAHGPEILGLISDITSEASLFEARDAILAKVGCIDTLDRKVEADPAGEPKQWLRLENLPLTLWNADIAVGLTGVSSARASSVRRW